MIVPISQSDVLIDPMLPKEHTQDSTPIMVLKDDDTFNKGDPVEVMGSYCLFEGLSAALTGVHWALQERAASRECAWPLCSLLLFLSCDFSLTTLLPQRLPGMGSPPKINISDLLLDLQNCMLCKPLFFLTFMVSSVLLQ